MTEKQIDTAVIQLFQAINHLSQDEKCSPAPLPEYKIENYTAQDGSSASIWEYIEGEPLNKKVSVEDFVKTADPKVKDSAEHMESVCRELGVSDLHRENIIVRSSGCPPLSFHGEIVPVDLENHQLGKGTGMFSLAMRPPPLSDQERDLIEQCRRKTTPLSL
jgi:hypothetical protein